MQYLYTIVRTDLPVEAQAVQAMHAASQYFLDNERPREGHPTFVFLQVPSSIELGTLLQYLECEHMFPVAFRETCPAMWGLTAISCLAEEHQRHHFDKLKLWKVDPIAVLKQRILGE